MAVCIEYISRKAGTPLEALAVELDDVGDPIRLVRCGLYTNIGQEVL